MKAERRHELKTNELVEWFTQLPEFWRRNVRLIIYIAAAVVVVAVVSYLKWHQAKASVLQRRVEVSKLVSQLWRDRLEAASAAAAGKDTSTGLLETASLLESIAQQADEDATVALALIKRAEALRAELHYRAVSLEPEAVRQQLERAVQCYQQALAGAAGNATLAGMAKLGLGLCAEELGDFEQARRIYSELAEQSEFEGTVSAAQARQRLETLTDYSQAVVFTEPPAAEQAIPRTSAAAGEPPALPELTNEPRTSPGAPEPQEPNNG
jgi:tetratricopeptide (TPR) repeat protein